MQPFTKILIENPQAMISECTEIGFHGYALVAMNLQKDLECAINKYNATLKYIQASVEKKKALIPKKSSITVHPPVPVPSPHLSLQQRAQQEREMQYHAQLQAQRAECDRQIKAHADYYSRPENQWLVRVPPSKRPRCADVQTCAREDDATVDEAN